MNKLPTYFEARKWASFRIQNLTQVDMTAIDFLLEKQLGLTTVELLSHYRDVMTAEQWQKFQVNVDQLVSGKPVQYIVGQADFYGLTLAVTPAVLIPRVETEELIDWVLTETAGYQNDPLRVLDIGTGSGAIAIALKKNRPNWQVTASDISDGALKVAEKNACRLQTSITFIQSDLFQNLTGSFDLIVSNPPYIAISEKSEMDASVIENEPAIALFAPQNGLAIYQRLAHEADRYLTSAGRLFLEIGFRQQAQVENIFHTSMPAATVIAKHDVAGHERMIEIKK